MQEINVFNLLTILLFAIFLSFSIAVPVINLLYKLKITRRMGSDTSAIIGDRSKSKDGTPIMGGLIIVISIILLNLIFNFNGSTKIPLLVFFLSALLGGMDDVLNIYGKARTVRPISRINKLIKVHKSKLMRIKYIVTYPWIVYKNFFFMLGSPPGKGIQAHEKILINAIAGVSVFLWVFFLSGWTDASSLFFPLGVIVDIGWLMFPFVIFTVLVMTNAVNIADGMDGLSAGMLIPAFIGFMIIALQQDNAHTAILCATAIGGTLAYLYFNIPPARVQMGDVGSLSMGTLLGVIALEMRVPFLLLIICFPFILEFASSLIQGIFRRVFGRRLFKMAPFHYHLQLSGWNEEKIVMRAWLLAIFCAILGVWVYLLY